VKLGFHKDVGRKLSRNGTLPSCFS
jgi:hypothetical protein